MAKAGLRLQKVTRTAIYEPSEPLPPVPAESLTADPSAANGPRSGRKASKQQQLLGAQTTAPAAPLTDATLTQATQAKQALKAAERAKLALAVRSLALAANHLRDVPGAGASADTLDRALKLALTQQGRLNVRSGLVVWSPERQPYMHGEAQPIDVAKLTALDAATLAVRQLPNLTQTASNLAQAASYARASLDRQLASVSAAGGAAAPHAKAARKALAVSTRALVPGQNVGADGPMTPATEPSQTLIKFGDYTPGPGDQPPKITKTKLSKKPAAKKSQQVRPAPQQVRPAPQQVRPATCPVCREPEQSRAGRWWAENKRWVPWALAGVLALRVYR